MKKRTTKDKSAWISKPYHGTNQRWMTQQLLPFQTYHYPYRKPSLYLRISLGTSKEQDHCCSTVIDLFHSFLNPSGSTSSMVTPLTSTMSSPTSTPSHMIVKNQLNLGNTSSCYTAHLLQPKLSKLTAIGLLHGKPPLKPLYSSSNTNNKSSSCMKSTSNISLPHSQVNSTLMLSTTTEPFTSELPNNVTSNYQISQNSQIYKSGGFKT